MDIVSYLRSLDWSALQVLFGLGFDRQNIDETIEMARQKCQKALTLLQTRCLFSTNLSAHLLNNRDEWWGTDLSTLATSIGLSHVKAINIEIDVTSRLDHMFVLANLGPTQESPTGWYLIQSYVNQYHTIIEPVDALKLIQTIQRWRVQGVNPDEWRYYFHADMPSTNRAIPHVYTVKEIYLSDVIKNVNNIYKRVSDLLSNPDSYIQNGKYLCLIQSYTQ